MDCVQPWSQGVRGEMGDEDPGLSFQGPGTEVGLFYASEPAYFFILVSRLMKPQGGYRFTSSF